MDPNRTLQSLNGAATALKATVGTGALTESSGSMRGTHGEGWHLP